MTVRVLATSPLVGESLDAMGREFPELLIAPFRSPAWTEALHRAEALVVLLSEPITESDLALAIQLKAIGTYSVGMDLLESGHLGGAGLDVYAGEPDLDRRWTTTPRTVLLPHLGSATTETRAAMAKRLCAGIALVLRGL